MIYHLSILLTSYCSWFNVIHYVSVRAILALLGALMYSFIFGDRFIEQSKLFFRSKAREFTPQAHRAKDNIPTMGGLFILSCVFINTLLWCDLGKLSVWLMLLCMAGFGAIGGWDDWCKIKYHKGLSARTKFILQLLVASLVLIIWIYGTGAPTTVVVPFFKQFQPDLGVLFIFWALFILIGTSNAVNLTDGLDGLAISSLMPNFVTFFVIAYLAGHVQFAHYLHIPFVATAEVSIIASILIGSSLGFLWYNTYPAQIFMGDVGSLALGAALGLIALMTKQELLLGIAGGLFVVETASVILQVLSYKFLGRRIFRMAPIHHHFELIGWQEAKITVRFGIISVILCLLALITLKLR